MAERFYKYQKRQLVKAPDGRIGRIHSRRSSAGVTDLGTPKAGGTPQYLVRFRTHPTVVHFEEEQLADARS